MIQAENLMVTGYGMVNKNTKIRRGVKEEHKVILFFTVLFHLFKSTSFQYSVCYSLLFLILGKVVTHMGNPWQHSINQSVQATRGSRDVQLGSLMMMNPVHIVYDLITGLLCRMFWVTPGKLFKQIISS